MVAWLGQKLFDTCGEDSSKHYLIDFPTKEPIQYMIFGGKSFVSPKGWSWFDAVHEKLVIVDGNVVVAGGRGWGASYVPYLDTDFVVRGPIVPVLSASYQEIWNAVRHETSPLKPKPVKIVGEPERFDSFPWTMTDAEHDELAAAFAFARAPRETSFIGEPAPGTPRVRVIHHDFISQLDKHGPLRGKFHSIKARLASLKDPIIEEAAAKLATAHEARFNMLNGAIHPVLYKAMREAVARGTSVDVFTNVSTYEEHKLLPFAPSWILTCQDVYKMVKAGVSVFGFVPAGEYTYLHRKMAIVGDTVFIGSHNFNAPSTFANDELDLEIEDPALAKDFAENLYDDALKTNGSKLDPTWVKKQARLLRPLKALIPHVIFRTM